MICASLPDPINGAIKLSVGALTLDVRLTEDHFLQSLDPDAVSVSVENRPYVTYRIIPQIQWANVETVMTATFFERVLHSISVSVFTGAESKGWADWSEEAERAKLTILEQVLRNAYGAPPYRYSWGTIGADYDSRAGFSAVTVRYA
jgi:hypothetical protein